MTSDGRSMRERMLTGDLYIADDPVLAEEHKRAMALVEAFNSSPASDPAERRRLLTDLLGSYGDGAEVRPPLYCDYGYQISTALAPSPTSGSSSSTWPA